jgi:hypothetical protein
MPCFRACPTLFFSEKSHLNANLLVFLQCIPLVFLRVISSLPFALSTLAPGGLKHTATLKKIGEEPDLSKIFEDFDKKRFDICTRTVCVHLYSIWTFKKVPETEDKGT